MGVYSFSSSVAVFSIAANIAVDEIYGLVYSQVAAVYSCPRTRKK